MKKCYLMIATAALVFAGCANNDTFRKDINESDATSNGAISFTSFADKVTKAENSTALYTETFFTHQESFQVWARKSNQPAQEIFNGSKVKVEEVTAGTYAYNYAPERFWDKTAEKYHFYAAAPARTTSDVWQWNFNGGGITTAATLNKGYFTTTGSVTLNGVNLKHVNNGGSDNALENVFKNIPVSSTNTATDIDMLIAAPTEVTQTYYNVANPSAVNLNFIHILSKLNVTIKTTLGTVEKTDGTGNHTYDVKLLAFDIQNVPNTSTGFNETANGITDANKKEIRWTAPTGTGTILTGIAGLDNEKQITNDAVAIPYNPTGAQKLYIVESLIIPQEIEYERVALDGGAHAAVNQSAVPYQSYEAYEAAKHNDTNRLTAEQFNALIKDDGQGGKTFADGISDANKAEITEVPAITLDEYTTPSKPYFHIVYSIDGEIFEANYNLAAAFLKYNNNEQKWNNSGELVDLETADLKEFPFYEGWQNTLNIIINPTAIEFTADVAKWADNSNVDYEIDKGNENPDTPAPSNP